MSLELFLNDDDWKDFLPDDARQVLMTVLDGTRKYRGSYIRSDDTKSAQLWCALIEMAKEVAYLKSELQHVKAPLQAIVSIGEAEKRKAMEKIVSEIITPASTENQEAIGKIVDSLARF